MCDRQDACCCLWLDTAGSTAVAAYWLQHKIDEGQLAFFSCVSLCQMDCCCSLPVQLLQLMSRLVTCSIPHANPWPLLLLLPLLALSWCDTAFVQ